MNGIWTMADCDYVDRFECRGEGGKNFALEATVYWGTGKKWKKKWGRQYS